MGIDVTNITGVLREYATAADADKNGILEGKEVSIFEAKSGEAVKQGIVLQEDVNKIFGFESSKVTNPIVSKKDAKKNQESVMKEVKSLVKAGTEQKVFFAKLNEKFKNTEYASAINEAAYVLNLVNATEYNSKQDVKKIHKVVKEQLKAAGKWDSFHKGLLEAFEDYAKQNQIDKEAQTLIETYKEAKEACNAEGLPLNFEEYAKIAEEEGKGSKSYRKQAIKQMEEYAKEDAKSYMSSKLEDTEGTSGRKIKKELNAQNTSGDKYQKEAVKDLKAERKIFARKNKFEDREAELKNVNRNDLQKELGRNLFEKLNRTYLPTIMNADGTYDLSKLAQEILDYTGQDYKVNQSKDEKMSEFENIKVRLADLTKVSKDDISDGDVKDLIKYVGLKREHKDRTPNLLKTIVGGVAGALGASSATRRLNVKQDVNVTVDDKTVAQEMIDSLKASGVKVDSTEIGGKISIKVHQEVLRDTRVLDILRGAGIGALTSAAFDVLFGNVKDEESCISVSDYDPSKETYTNPELYKEHFANTTKNEEKRNMMNLLVDEYAKAYGDEWHSKLHETILKAAGTGSKLNPEECKMLKYQKVETPTVKPEKETVDEPVKVSEPKPEPCNVEAWSDTVDKTVTHTRQGGDTWGGIVKAYYPCLVQEKGLSGAIRALKTALATDENGNIDRATYQALLKGGDLPKTMKLPAKIGDCDIVKDAKVKRVKVHGNGKARIQSVGRDSKETTWTAQDCKNRQATGKTEAEARENLKKISK